MDASLTISCYSNDLSEWKKHLIGKRQSLSEAIRDILNREVELRKLEKK